MRNCKEHSVSEFRSTIARRFCKSRGRSSGRDSGDLSSLERVTITGKHVLRINYRPQVSKATAPSEGIPCESTAGRFFARDATSTREKKCEIAFNLADPSSLLRRRGHLLDGGDGEHRSRTRGDKLCTVATNTLPRTSSRL